ncbi:MAG: phosphatase PAP2/dual specificity phosphatase family protein [Candidatus Contendobacter sp.]|nr:phosphatase PAP2/dual specificity phosphatase family protein [Candidatus Contendobacter sp.]MDS4060008.1 phosphatase PAP2/dual specificity phosphatase family protein [Candidatus Contendobacter sp.]
MTERKIEIAEPRPWRAAVGWMVLVLGPGFFLIYGACNGLTSLRADVGSFLFEWERRIPVLPWTIIPYWSLDLFYAFSVLLCRTRLELDRHAFRIVTAVLLSAVGFLLFPLRFAFPRPEVEGMFGTLFQVLYGFDQPFNQAPSLHVSLGMIMWYLYAKYTRGLLRGLLHGWFILIFVSTLTTWQHHFIDLPTGALVGVIAFWLFPDPAADSIGKTVAYRPKGGIRLAGRYLAGASISLALALQGGFWLLFLWPGVSLGIVAAAYAGRGPVVFRKEGGRLAWAAKLVLGPYLAGQYLSWRGHRRKMATPLAEILPGVFVGARLDDGEAEAFAATHPRLLALDLTGDFDEAGPLRAGDYVNLQIMDLTSPPPRALRDAAVRIEAAVQQGRPVLVHCALGYSRSACVMASWLATTGRARSIQEAIERIRVVRPGIVVAPKSLAMLADARLAEEAT